MGDSKNLTGSIVFSRAPTLKAKNESFKGENELSYSLGMEEENMGMKMLGIYYVTQDNQ